MLAVLAGAAVAGTVFVGEDVAAAVASSVEINESLLQILQADARYGRPQSYFGTTVRWAPGRFELSDGSLLAGNLARYQIAGGIGVGSIEKVGLHTGIAMDGIGETGAAGMGYGGYQEILYLGADWKGFALTLNARVDFLGGGTNNLDPWVQFESRDAAYSYRAPLPFDNTPDATHGKTWSLYHGPTGAYAYVTYGGGVLYDARVQLQPLARLLPDDFGLPEAGLRWIDDRASGLFPTEDAPAPTGFAALEPPKKRFQSDLGTDDALHVGLRTRLVVEWLPVPAFRYAELGMVKGIGELGGSPFGFGFRGALAHPEGTFRPALESFAMVGIPKDGASVGHLALSYSYGVPDSSTFIPIPNAHVFGFQVVAGRPETSRPIVPIVRGLDAG